jgi:hypothetical protein
MVQGGDLMSEDKKGHMKVTFEFEANEMFMDTMKDFMAKIPEMMSKRAETTAKKVTEK